MPSSGCQTCARSEEHTSELQSHDNLVCRLLLEKKPKVRTQKRGSGADQRGLRREEPHRPQPRRAADEHPPLRAVPPPRHVQIRVFFFNCAAAPENLPPSPTRGLPD